MAVQVTYPGVYIEEFAPGAPIQGVSTSIPAFIGIAAKGDLDLPTRVTSFDDFKVQFGEQPVSGFYIWHAVRGFFDNGGQTCYIVRASNGQYASVVIQNRGGNDYVRARARQPGNPAAPVTVQITGQNLITGASLYRPQGSATAITGRTLTMTDAFEAAQFRPTDFVDVGGTRAQVIRVSGDQIQLATDPGVAVPAAVRLADLAVGERTFRLQAAGFPSPLPQNQLVPGIVLTLTQGGNTDTQVVEGVQLEYLQTNPTASTYRILTRDGLKNTYDMTQAIQAQSEEVTIQVTQNGVGPTYTGLGLDPAHRRFFREVINNEDELVRLEPAVPPPTDQLPDNLLGTGNFPLINGAPEDLTALTDLDYMDALETLRSIDEVTLVAAPGITTPAVQQALIAHCELLADRFAVLDAINGIPLSGTPNIEDQRNTVDSTRGYSALYYPWLRVISASTGKEILVPPSGHICGIMARVDTTKGVHKAPANEIVRGAFGVQTTMSNQEQGLLNPRGINVIRVFQQGGAPVVWGARTTATDLNWMYVNVRRLFIYVEESIQEGINYAVFEPNDQKLWKKLKLSISEFLSRVWRDGGLFGETAGQAYYVRIDESLNPESEKRLGRLNIEIGMRPTFPAEFIIVRIGIWQGGSEINEG
jgi:hypothetical protein